MALMLALMQVPVPMAMQALMLRRAPTVQSKALAPAQAAVLLARVHAVLRRAGVEERGELLQLGELRVDLAARTATWPDRVEELTPVEVDILRHFCARRGVALDRGAVLKDLWGLDGRVTTRTLDNHVARLRRKIEPDPAHPRWLVTVHGVGYRLEV